MNLGTFSVSLAVEDLSRSLAFYETLGFTQLAGNADEGWLVLGNGEAKIGLFQGMFEGNLLTFNPPDARRVQATLQAAGYAPVKPAEGEAGPCHFVIEDPDSNPILVDQH